MKRRTVIRAAILLVSLCVTAWQLPTLMVKAESMRSSLLGPDIAGAVEFELPPEAAALAALQAGSQGKSGVILLSPAGDELTPEEREALIAQARNLAPRKPETAKRQKRPQR